MVGTLIEELESKISKDLEDKYFEKFSKQASYIGNGIYNVSGTDLYSTDTRELFLMYIASHENIKFSKY